ncbi:long-chain fatty acid--CoA ligase [Amycolatopsis sp. DG1A-15b]|uniref:long-chain fatty acid--CoA ligase n=1 Tax=Amycolatopsis sp. DG1A-15b TaxID=3052846 RepID=UPI00255C1028|nr:long-chain fatty acid--CoA ligase [Amycolatopsis sp. DG1A-15b]WIX90462.1 long-chain fatty acid--CoA ligase [Amycolatopsis sp. DG1A-15b]
MWTELTPAELLSADLAAPRIADRAWLVRWDRSAPDAEELARRVLPDPVDLRTSGTTGPGRVWRRTFDQLWAEAGLLADLLRPRTPAAVLSFAPPRHIFGLLATVLVPARLGIPVWYRPDLFGPMPEEQHPRWAVVAIPWVFSLLRRNISWVRSLDHLAVLHSTATLPAAAGGFLAAAGPGRVSVTEVFGSTETGGVAKRVWAGGNPPWELFDDVSLVSGPDTGSGAEVPLRIAGPRLAAVPGEPPPADLTMDDFVRPVGDRAFSFVGRRSSLVKVNGRRLDLDELERSLRAVLPCADLALVPVTDDLTGEHLDLHVVPENGHDIDVQAVRRHLGVLPRKVLVRDRIDRTDTGKTRRVDHARTDGTGANR